jgi:hypothetical protein
VAGLHLLAHDSSSMTFQHPIIDAGRPGGVKGGREPAG